MTKGESRRERYAARLAQLWVYLTLFLLAVGVCLSQDIIIIIVGLAGILLAGLLAHYAFKAQRRQISSDRISKTYPFRVPAVQTYPEYQVPPDPDLRAKLRFGCAPLLDCCFPLLMRELDPFTWECLARSHAIDVDIHIADFSRLFQSVVTPDSKSGVDIVVASAASVHRAQLGNGGAKNADAPVAILPILQQFNAYYLFAHRDQLLKFFAHNGQPEFAEIVKKIGRDDSLVSKLEHRSVKKRDGTEDVILRILQDFDVYVERGADLDAALTAFWVKRGGKGEGSQSLINYATPDYGSIQETFETFQSSKKKSVFMGGIGQTAFLLNRCGPDDEFVILANAGDFSYQNVNSLVCSRGLIGGRANEVFRFIGWWFDIVNCFRRQYLFVEANDLGHWDNLRQLVLRGSTANGQRFHLLPADATLEDVDRALTFLKLRSANEIGNFLLPNIHAALEINTELTDKLHQLDAAVDLMVPKTESTAAQRG